MRVQSLRDGLSHYARGWLTDSVQVWRDPNVTAATPAADQDAYGLPVQTAAPDASGPLTLIATYDCELEQDQKRPAGEDYAGEQPEGLLRWIVSILEVDAPDIRLGDTLVCDGHTLRVMDPSGTGTHNMVRLVRCMEVGG